MKVKNESRNKSSLAERLNPGADHQRHPGFLLFILFCILILTISPVYAAGTANQIILAGGDENFYPYEYIDDSGQPAGFNIDLLNAISEEMNLNISIELETWHKVRKDLENGRIDLITGMYYSEERDRTINFSNHYIIVSNAIFVREGSDIRSLKDISGKEIVVQNGAMMYNYVKSNEISDRIIPVDDASEAFLLLASGSHDCALLSKLHGEFLITKTGISGIETVGSPIEPQKLCFAASAEGSEFLPVLNEGLAIIKKNGRYDEIYNKWFGVYEEHEFYSTLLNLILFLLLPFIILLTVALVWSFSLRKQVAKKSAELKEKLIQQKKIEGALKESKNKYHELFDSINEAVFLHEVLPDNKSSNFTEVNETACRRLGYTRDELLQMKISDIIRPEILEYNSIQAEIIEKGNHFSFYTEHIRKDGSVFPVYIKARILEFGDRKYILQLARDISEEKESRRREGDALKQIEENISQLAILNDEIRNPLTVIIGAVDMEMENSADIILKQADEINKLIRKLDQGWLESEKIREYLRKHHEIDDTEDMEDSGEK
ncbi:MAG: transporter substrate-binding domain-containing protein [Euryarchaeota archaeon]|nr:transporter substrate-binding domain-containing protein [Euryarchaeota archaeon]